MDILYVLFIVSIFSIGFYFKSKKIKDIKLHNISILHILGILYLSIVIIIVYIVPIPSYYIKHKENRYIEEVIETEMTRSNILYDKDSLKVVNRFIGKYNQLYISTYEFDGEEQARMFDFKVNIFGDLKPSHDFSDSKVILKDELNDEHNYRIIRDGIPAFYITYGYSNNEEEEINNYVVGKFVVNNINPEGYYIVVTRNDDWSPFGIEIIIFAILLIAVTIRDKKKLTYSETKLVSKWNIPFEIEYYLV